MAWRSLAHGSGSTSAGSHGQTRAGRVGRSACLRCSRPARSAGGRSHDHARASARANARRLTDGGAGPHMDALIPQISGPRAPQRRSRPGVTRRNQPEQHQILQEAIMHDIGPAAALVAAGQRPIGVAVRQGRGLAFTATDPSFALLDGSRYGSSNSSRRPTIGPSGRPAAAAGRADPIAWNVLMVRAERCRPRAGSAMGAVRDSAAGRRGDCHRAVSRAPAAELAGVIGIGQTPQGALRRGSVRRAAGCPGYGSVRESGWVDPVRRLGGHRLFLKPDRRCRGQPPPSEASRSGWRRGIGSVAQASRVRTSRTARCARVTALGYWRSVDRTPAHRSRNRSPLWRRRHRNFESTHFLSYQ